MIGAQRYKQTQTATASRERVLVLLLQGCRRAMSTADEQLAGGDVAAAEPNLRKAIDIVAELNATLDPRQAPELVAMLADVYAFVLQRLLAATQGSREALSDAQRAFLPIAEAFEQAVMIAANGAGSSAAAMR